MVPQVEFCICPEQAYVFYASLRQTTFGKGVSPAVHHRYGLADVGNHIPAADLEAGDIDEYGLVCPASTAFLHSAPVLERRADEGVRRYHCEGVVPVTYLDGVEGDLFDSPVGTPVRHLYPVSYADHPVLGQLYAGNESEDAVLEYEHKHGGRCSQSGQQYGWRLVDQHGGYYYASDEIKYYLQPLYKTLKGMTAVLVGGSVEVQKCQQHRVTYHNHHYEHIYDVGSVQKPDYARILLKSDVRKEIQYKARNQQEQVMSYPALHQKRMPF